MRYNNKNVDVALMTEFNHTGALYMTQYFCRFVDSFNYFIYLQITDTSTFVPNTVAGCLVPHIPDHVSVEGNCLEVGEAVEVGTVCQFSCDLGYRFEGNSSSLCQSDGFFSHDFPSCTKVVKNNTKGMIKGY